MMKIVIFILILLFGVSSVYYFKSDQYCHSLVEKSKNKALVASIWNEAAFYFDDPKYLDGLNLVGLIQANEVDGALNINWSALGIPLEYATVEYVGNDLNYSNVEAHKVKEVRVGYGYRFHLVYKLNESTELVNYPKNASEISYSISVECRTE